VPCPGAFAQHAGRSGAPLPFVPAVQRPAAAQDTLDLFFWQQMFAFDKFELHLSAVISATS
jgi:hypothetical protein